MFSVFGVVTKVDTAFLFAHLALSCFVQPVRSKLLKGRRFRRRKPSERPITRKCATSSKRHFLLTHMTLMRQDILLGTKQSANTCGNSIDLFQPTNGFSIERGADLNVFASRC